MPIVRSFTKLLSSWRGRFIVVFLAIQLLLPLSYYVARRDKHDERWAWRMFSPTRQLHCQPEFTVDDQPLVVRTKFHEAWAEIAERGRFGVIEAMAARLCRDNPGKAVRVTLTCTRLDKTQEHFGGYNMCSVPEL